MEHHNVRVSDEEKQTIRGTRPSNKLNVVEIQFRAMEVCACSFMFAHNGAAT